IADISATLQQELWNSGGLLLVQSRGGLGKTRVVAELVKNLCIEEAWTICVAKGEGDLRIDALDALPHELRHTRLLFVLDDLHQRTTASGEPYIVRLRRFWEFFEHRLAPGDCYLIATARTEPQYQTLLGFNASHPFWNRFKRFDLPEPDP